MLNGLELFTEDNNSQNKTSEAIRAELYTRIYKWAAEDFTSTADMKKFSDDVVKWAQLVENRLSRLGYALSTHTHPVTQHFHAGGQGPAIGGLTTLTPTTGERLKWPREEVFKRIDNTTGAKSNIRSNKISETRIPSIGDKEYGAKGRALVINVLRSKTLQTIVVSK